MEIGLWHLATLESPGLNLLTQNWFSILYTRDLDLQLIIVQQLIISNLDKKNQAIDNGFSQLTEGVIKNAPATAYAKWYHGFIRRQCGRHYNSKGTDAL